MSPKLLGALRTIAYIAIAAVVHWAASAVNLAPFLNGSLSILIAAFAGGLDHQIQANGNGALFGAMRSPVGR